MTKRTTWTKESLGVWRPSFLAVAADVQETHSQGSLVLIIERVRFRFLADKYVPFFQWLQLGNTTMSLVR